MKHPQQPSVHQPPIQHLKTKSVPKMASNPRDLLASSSVHRRLVTVPGIAATYTKSPHQTKRNHPAANDDSTVRNPMTTNVQARSERRNCLARPSDNTEQVTAEASQKEESRDGTMDRWERCFRLGARFSIFLHVCMFAGLIVTLTVALGSLIRSWEGVVDWVEDYLSALREVGLCECNAGYSNTCWS